MKRFCLSVLVAALCAAPQTALAQDLDAAVMERISEVNAEIRSLQCDFVQTRRHSMLEGEMTARGKMYYRQGGFLRWEYDSPYSYSMVMNGTLASFGGEGQSEVMDMNRSRMFRETGRILMNCLLGRSLVDEADFSVSLSETATVWVAQLVPQRREMKRILSGIVLHFSKETCLVKSVELVESGGDTTTIEIRNVLTNIDIDDSVFEIAENGE